MKKNMRKMQKGMVVLAVISLVCVSTNVYALLTSQTGFVYPADSYWGREYVGWLQWNSGMQKYHLGVDFKKNFGDPIYAIADGEVMGATTQYMRGQDCGGALSIKHQTSDGSYFTAVYGHITIGKGVGDTVKAGEQIGTIANCWVGGLNLLHLHFAISLDASKIWDPGYTSSQSNTLGWVDPLAFLETQAPASPAEAPLRHSARIDDNFIGKGYEYNEQYRPDLLSQEPNYAYADVISWRNWDKFDIQWMDVNIDENRMAVNIRTDYTPGIVPGTTDHRTTYGDLFISTNGWTPDSEVWEYVFDTSTGNLYDIRNVGDHILFSDNVYGAVYGSQTYRHGQEVEINPADLVAVGNGSTGKQGDYYALNFDISALNLVAGMTLGFHWTMSCANDVIEGMTTLATPEPSTLVLFGSGLLGAFALRRKYLRA